MNRVSLACAYAGTLIFAAAAALDLGALGSGCMLLECPPESYLATALQSRLLDFAMLCIPGALAFAIGWVLRLVALASARRRTWFAIVAISVPVGLGLALLVALGPGGGHLFPTTWRAYSTWRNDVFLPLPPLLLGPLVTIVAGHMAQTRTRRAWAHEAR